MVRRVSLAEVPDPTTDSPLSEQTKIFADLQAKYFSRLTIFSHGKGERVVVVNIITEI